ncbi:proline--tRNA ligase [archaeon]|nr:proline--tRNA ligase [archaeon]|tara:strand:- start:9491 stop:10954 length:1464 start_codon:yes stop_codon:yes gene_type:complete
MAKKEKKGITVKKDENFSEWYTQVVERAKLADIRFGIQGFIVNMPFGFSIIRKIYEYLEEEVEEDNHEAFLFPNVVKEIDLKKEKEHAGFNPEVFWVSEVGDKKLEERFALRPTGEAQIYPMYSLWFRSYKDLPFKGYQSRISVFRAEKTTRPFIRGREFLFFETHDVFNTHNESLEQIKKDLEICNKTIRDKIKIPFLFFKRPSWDKFLGADNSFTPDTVLPDGKRTQLASTHDLGRNFSKAFGIRVENENEEEEFVWQTCFGPGISRIMASLISIHGDDKGLILPFDMAPIQIVIIPIIFSEKDNKPVLKYCVDIEKKLKEYKVKFDNSENSPGYKFNEWELKGVPIRIEVGPKETKDKKITIVLRTGEKKSIKLDSLLKEVEKSSKLIDKNIEDKANLYFKNKTKNAKSYDELKNIIENYKGFIKVPFCSVEKDGEKCANKLKEETAADVSGTLYPKEDKILKESKCIICNKKAKHIVYVAKSY